MGAGINIYFKVGHFDGLSDQVFCKLQNIYSCFFLIGQLFSVSQIDYLYKSESGKHLNDPN